MVVEVSNKPKKGLTIIYNESEKRIANYNNKNIS